MTLSVGDIVRKVQRDNTDAFVEGEAHFEYRVLTSPEYSLEMVTEADGTEHGVQTVTVKLAVLR